MCFLPFQNTYLAAMCPQRRLFRGEGLYWENPVPTEEHLPGMPLSPNLQYFVLE